MGTLTNCFINNIIWGTHTENCSLPLKGEVHLWRINITANLYRLHELKALLKPDELMRGDKYHQLKDRQRFVVSRGMQRIILGKYLKNNPGQLNFVLGDNKKPYLPTGNGIELYYNVSHSGDWVVLAVSQSPVGVDMEFIDPDFPFDDILPEHFSEDERRLIYTADKTKRFYLLWTRKEALLKATGQGLGEHLRHTPSLDGLNILNSNFLGADKDWYQQSFLITDDYMASVAATGECQLKAFDINF